MTSRDGWWYVYIGIQVSVFLYNGGAIVKLFSFMIRRCISDRVQLLFGLIGAGVVGFNMFLSLKLKKQIPNKVLVSVPAFRVF